MGVKKVVINGEEFAEVVLSLNPNEIPGEAHEIIADSGEGSFGDIYMKLLKKMNEESKHEN